MLLGFLGSVPVLDGAGLGSALSKPPRFLELLGGATGSNLSFQLLGSCGLSP